MRATDHSGPTRRRVLQATAGLLATGMAGTVAGDDESESDQGDGEGVRCADASEVSDGDADSEPTEHVPGTVTELRSDTHHEPGLMVVRLDDGRTVRGSPDVYHVGEGDRVVAAVRDGRLIGVASDD